MGGGNLVLSALGASVNSTFCGQCHHGIISAGSVTGQLERARIREQLLQRSLGRPVPAIWSGPININSPLVLGCPHDEKARCAHGIVDWYKRVKGIEIVPSEVYMFDDRIDATEGFEKYGFNARQVSCGSRDDGGVVGLCGARPKEI